MPQHILALDQGTTSSRAILFGRDGRACAVAQQELPQHYPLPGHVEHNPDDIWHSQYTVAQQVLQEAGISADEVAAIGVTNQRETTILWERKTGRPVANAIVWQSRITADVCQRLRDDGAESLVREKTGLRLDPYFSATKIRYLLDQTPGLTQRAERGDILFGTVDSFLIWKLSGGRRHVTDVSNASRTLLFNIHTRQWDEELLHLFGVPRAMLPEVASSSEVYAETEASLFGRSLPVAGCAGDQQAATFGQGCFAAGTAKNTYGTGCFLLMNTGPQPVASQHGLLTTIGWQRGEEVTYCLEGSVFIGGAVVQWLRDGLQILDSAAEVQTLAESVADNGGVYFVPAFVGLGAPYWNSRARGTLLGLTRGTQRGHIARAALEAIAYQNRDVLQAMQHDAGITLNTLKVDGGATANNWLMQFQADLLGVPVQRPVVQETTALGAAYLAGLAVGFWKDQQDVARHWALDRQFSPAANRQPLEKMYARWQQAVRRSLDWEE